MYLLLPFSGMREEIIAPHPQTRRNCRIELNFRVAIPAAFVFSILISTPDLHNWKQKPTQNCKFENRVLGIYIDGKGLEEEMVFLFQSKNQILHLPLKS